MNTKDDAGASLIEIVMAIVILGVVVSSLLAALGTAALSSKAHRDLTTADTVLRSYAEATKAAVRHDCTSPGLPVVVTPPQGVPGGYSVTLTPNPLICPPPTTVVQVHISLTAPVTKSLDIDVRTP